MLRALEAIEQLRHDEPTREDQLVDECNSLRERLDASEAQCAAWQAKAIDIGQKYDGLVASIRTAIARLESQMEKPGAVAYTCEDYSEGMVSPV